MIEVFIRIYPLERQRNSLFSLFTATVVVNENLGDRAPLLGPALRGLTPLYTSPKHPLPSGVFSLMVTSPGNTSQGSKEKVDWRGFKIIGHWLKDPLRVKIMTSSS